MHEMRTPLSTSGIVQLVIRRPIRGHRADSEFFTTWDTLECARWQARRAAEALQIAPSMHFGFRPFAHEFHLAEPVQVARSIARANPQYGTGGGEKLFIPAAAHARALVPVGDLIPLFATRDGVEARASGFIEELICLEASLGNSLVSSDRETESHDRRRFWLQEPLHLADIGRALNAPRSVRTFEEADIHGGAMGFIDDNGSQVLVAPIAMLPPKGSLFSNLGRGFSSS